jgi:hypothetical protein
MSNSKELLETLKQLQGLIKDFEGMGVDIIETSMAEGKIWLYFKFDYTFIKTMIRGNYEIVEEISWTKMVFKKDNVFYVTYRPYGNESK